MKAIKSVILRTTTKYNEGKLITRRSKELLKGIMHSNSIQVYLAQHLTYSEAAN